MDAVVERSVDLEASADEVWRALTDPVELAGWLGVEVDLEPTPGTRGRVVDDDGVARDLVVDDVVAGERLVLRWWPAQGSDGASVVTFAVAPTPQGTRLVVTERLLAPADVSLRAAATSAATAWQWRLDLLLLRLGAVCCV